jgi:hypothetical protein
MVYAARKRKQYHNRMPLIDLGEIVRDGRPGRVRGVLLATPGAPQVGRGLRG